MALDNAQFISELSITDPPGTDPLSEGDDQIRTAKRAVFQSFPFVDKQVDLTADQLNDVALKSVTNTFTSSQLFIGTVNLRATSTGASARLAWQDTTGFDRWRVDKTQETGNVNWRVQRFDAAGALVDTPLTLRGDSGVVEIVQPIRAGLGSATAPSFSFTADTTMGMFRGGAGLLDFGINALLFRISAAAIIAKSSFHQRDASVSAPSYAFENETDTGIFRSALGEMSFTSRASIVLITKPNTINMNLPLGDAGLVSGDLFRSTSAFNFIEIVP